jgi:group I intron endonuclease
MIVYKITNKITDKSYIGITKYTAHKRWKKHLERVLEGINTALYCAIRKYGTSAFDIETIYEAINELEALKVESGLIASHNTLIPNGYNMTAGGSNPFGCKSRRNQR